MKTSEPEQSGANTEAEGSTERITRREFLHSSACTSATFILGCLFNGEIVALDADADSERLEVKSWVRIGPDNKVTIIVSQAEMGQGIMSTLPAILAEELGADWEKVQLEMSPTAHAYRNPRLKWQFTGNSESTMSFFDLMRQVGASALEMLIGAAAERWKVATASCVAENSYVIHP